MITLNWEADELLMQTCMQVKKVKYYALFKNGTKYHLTDRYRVNGRFNRKSVEMYFARKKLVLNDTYTIVAEETYPDTIDLGLFLMKQQIKKVQYLTNADRVNFWLGPEDKSNFRFALAKTQPYKGDRAEKPAIREALREYLVNVENAQIAYGYEADDMLGIHQTDGTIAVHCDKDINQIPGKHFNTMTDSLWYCEDPGQLALSQGKTSKIEGHGVAFFYVQLLTGDKTDTIPPLKSGKWGPVKVYNLLQDCKEEGEYIEKIVSCYKEVCGDGWKDRLLEQADLVWICRKYGETGAVYLGNKLDDCKYT